MSFPTQPDVLGHLSDNGPQTIRELVDAFADPRDDRRALEAQVHTYLLRMKRMKLVEMVPDPGGGRGRIWAATKEEDD